MTDTKTNTLKPILTITGSDSTGESGVQADIKTITALGGSAMTAITSITVQTTLGIQEFHDLPAGIVADQMEAVMNDMQPRIVKVGLIRSREVLDIVVGILQRYRPQHIIYDPVVYSSRGEMLISNEVVQAINSMLLPLCTMIIGKEKYAGGLLVGKHGLSNAFSSAVAVFLNQGDEPDVALEKARAYINTLYVRSAGLQGRSYELYQEFLGELENHVNTYSDVAFYADRLNVSSRYLAQVCRRIAGKSPKTIIDERLLREIEKMMATTDSTLQEIAFAFGFSSQAHFTKFFKKQTGITPSVFRAKR